MRRGISVRSYWRDTSQLPSPIRGKGKHLFLEEEVDNLIDGLLAAREREKFGLPGRTKQRCTLGPTGDADDR